VPLICPPQKSLWVFHLPLPRFPHVYWPSALSTTQESRDHHLFISKSLMPSPGPSQGTGLQMWASFLCTSVSLHCTRHSNCSLLCRAGSLRLRDFSLANPRSQRLTPSLLTPRIFFLQNPHGFLHALLLCTQLWMWLFILPSEMDAQ
jgi:hypothetical protein